MPAIFSIMGTNHLSSIKEVKSYEMSESRGVSCLLPQSDIVTFLIVNWVVSVYCAQINERWQSVLGISYQSFLDLLCGNHEDDLGNPRHNEISLNHLQDVCLKENMCLLLLGRVLLSGRQRTEAD